VSPLTTLPFFPVFFLPFAPNTNPLNHLTHTQRHSFRPHNHTVLLYQLSQCTPMSH